MENFYKLADEDKEKRLQGLAVEALESFGIPRNSRLSLLGRRENAVFSVNDSATDKRYVIRVHRYDYQTEASVNSELEWIKALRLAGIDTPEFVTGLNGKAVQLVSSVDVPEPHLCDLCHWVKGAPPEESNIVESYRMLGEINAQIHNQAQDWQPSESFSRQSWSEDGMLGKDPVWGRFWELEGVTDEQNNLLLKARDLAYSRLQAFGKTSDRFGLIHADLMPENILVDNGNSLVIDFDDCGFGWNLYDLATSLWMHEGENYYQQIYAAWVEGYRKVRELPESHLQQLSTLLMARGLVALGWLHTRRETEVARQYTPVIIEKVCQQATDYLAAE